MSKTSPVLFEPVTVPAAKLEKHPHQIFRHYRPLTPLLKRDDGVYIAIRAEDVQTLITDARTRQMETEIARSRGVTSGPLFQFLQNTMLLSNGLVHRQRRAPLSRAFAFEFITGLRPRIRAIADDIIDRCYEQGEMDLIGEYATWLPARVICTILGVREAHIAAVTQHVYSLTRVFGSSFSKEDVPELQTAADELMCYADDLLQDRHINPCDDFLTSYADGLDKSQALSHGEALAQIVTLLLAGIDTTRGALAIQTSLLLEHRQQWDAVCRDSSLIAGAVLECLRYEPSVASFPRVALEDIRLDGVLLPRNSVVSLSTLSAMRDPALYGDPDIFNIKRSDQPRRQLVFGGGVHQCLGNILAKVELEEGLAALAARLPNLELDGDPVTVQGSGGIRTVKNLRVRWRRPI